MIGDTHDHGNVRKSAYAEVSVLRLLITRSKANYYSLFREGRPPNRSTRTHRGSIAIYIACSSCNATVQACFYALYDIRLDNAKAYRVWRKCDQTYEEMFSSVGDSSQHLSLHTYLHVIHTYSVTTDGLTQK